MRILFLAPAYAGLHIPIIEEMKRQGHDVVWIDDTAIQYDMRIPRHGILNKMRCKVSTVLRHPSKKVWDKIFKERSEELKTTFDMFSASMVAHFARNCLCFWIRCPTSKRYFTYGILSLYLISIAIKIGSINAIRLIWMIQ